MTEWARSIVRSRRAAFAAVMGVSAIGILAYWARADADDAMVATAVKGELVARLTSSGTLKPIQSITYRSPIPGRDIEIRDLAPEGSRVGRERRGTSGGGSRTVRLAVRHLFDGTHRNQRKRPLSVYVVAVG